MFNSFGFNTTNYNSALAMAVGAVVVGILSNPIILSSNDTVITLSSN